MYGFYIKINTTKREELTRINIGVKPSELCRQHLLAEHREIIRIPNQVCSGKLKLDKPIPEFFSLGKGHVRFFIDKQIYLKNRYSELFWECVKRGYKVQDYINCWDKVPIHLMQDYIPTTQDVILIKDRIAERLSTMNNV